MSRIRTIKPEFFSSQQVAECSPTSRLLFVGLWCFADDHGVHPDRPRQLKMSVFPGDDNITVRNVTTMIDELVRVGLLRRYTVNDEAFLIVTGWKHQRIDKPRFRYPLPNGQRNGVEHSEMSIGEVDDHSENDIRSTLTLTHTGVDPSQSPPSGIEAEKQPRAKPRKPVPDDFTPNDDDYLEGKKLGMGQIEVMRAVPEFVRFWKGEGKLKADWHATFQNRLAWLAERNSGTVGGKIPLAKIGKPNPLVGSPEWRAANGMDPEAE